MDLKQLAILLECENVPEINRRFERSFDPARDIEAVKRLYVEEYCRNNKLKLCESDADFVMAAVSMAPQGEAAEFLCNRGYVVTDAGENARMERIQTYQDETAKSVQPVSAMKSAVPSGYNAQSGPVPFKLMPRPVQHDWACPFCNEVMGEKNFSFKPVGDFNYTHTCAPGRLIQHPEIDKAKAELAAFEAKMSNIKFN